MELITWGILGFARDHARNLRETRGKVTDGLHPNPPVPAWKEEGPIQVFCAVEPCVAVGPV
jgi:hypothetical protein